MAAASCRLPNGLWPGGREELLSQPLKPAPAVPFKSPYDLFRREQQPLQPPGLSRQDREKRFGELPPYSSSPSLTLALPYVQCAAGQLWRALPETKKAKYKAGLTCLAPLGQGGKRTWVPTSAPSLLLAPTTKATMMHSNERRSSGSCHFTVTPVPPRPPTAPAAASAAVPHAPSITPTIPSSSWLKQQQLEEESSGSVWNASGVSQSK